MRTVFLTGASGGIGAATAVAFHKCGWRVVGMDRRLPGDHIPIDRFHRVDFADSDAILAMLDELSDERRVDALVNNAASPMDKPFLTISLHDWQQTMDVNVRAAFIMTQQLMPQLERTKGSVVNVSSVHAVATSPGVTAYAASKGALVAFTRAVAVEVAGQGVRVNAVLPGATDTPMLRAGIARAMRSTEANVDVEVAMRALAARTPLGVIGHPEDIAKSIVFLADADQSGFMTAQALIIDGGATARLSTE